METFTINGNTETIQYSDKAKQAGVCGLYITAKRWFQKSYGNTYHTVTVKAVDANGNLSKVLVESYKEAYGYGEQYLETAVELLTKEGWLECTNEYAFANRSVREALNVEHSAQDVRLKRELF